ncbi:MAG: N-acetylneuraminate synthase [Alphaproteobacteria bacterium]
MSSLSFGPGEACFVIAEAGVNHNGDLDTALALVDAAADAGADAVKFQTFSATRLVTADAPMADYQKAAYQKTGGDVETQADMLARLELDSDAHRALMAHAAKKDILFLSSPFDEESADFLDGLDICAFKIPSGELTNHAFLAHVAAFGRTMIVSTGMANMDEVIDAVDVIGRAGNPELALLHCVSAYPAEPDDCNLLAMMAMMEAFPVAVGWSDHTRGADVCLAAVALGADIIEKHLTLDRSMVGPDHAASMTPDEFAAMVASIRTVERALGDGVKQPRPVESDVATVARKSLIAARDIASGETLRAGDVVIRRPGTGIPPYMLGAYTGRSLTSDVQAGSVLSEDMFKP